MKKLISPCKNLSGNIKNISPKSENSKAVNIKYLYVPSKFMLATMAIIIIEMVVKGLKM